MSVPGSRRAARKALLSPSAKDNLKIYKIKIQPE